MLGTLNVGNLLIVAGLGCLAAGFWLPYGTAGRVYRIETRAAKFTDAIRDALRERGPAHPPWRDEAVAAALAKATNAKLGLTNPEGSIFLHVRKPPAKFADRAMWFESKHYFYMVTSTPPAVLGDDGPVVGPESATDDNPKDAGAPVKTPDQKPGDRTSKDQASKDQAPKDAPTKKPAKPKAPRIPPIEVYAWPKDKRKGAQTVYYFPTVGADSFYRNLGGRYNGENKVPRPGSGFLHHLYRDGIYYGQDDQRWHYVDKKNAPNPPVAKKDVSAPQPTKK